RKKGVPTPKILEVCNDVIGLPYMISRKVAGQPAETEGCNRLAVVRELGGYAAKINAIKTRDFGHIFDWSPNTLSRNRTWQEYLEKELHVEKRMETLQRSRILQGAKLNKLRREARLMKRWKQKASLSHGDLRL